MDGALQYFDDYRHEEYMKNKWNKTRYFVTEVAQKLCCDPVDIIQYGTLNKLRIAAYINVGADKIKTIHHSDYPYEYSSDIYYINSDNLFHLEFMDKLDNIKARDIITIRAYKDDHKLFYATKEYTIFDYDNSKYNNFLEEVDMTAEDYMMNLPANTYDLDTDDDYETELYTSCDYDVDETEHDVETDIYYTIYRKNLIILHDDLMLFLQNEEQYKREFESIERDRLSSENLDQKSPVKFTSLKKGGRIKGSLAEAVEHAYIKLLKKGNTEILRLGKPREFLDRLKEMATEGNPNEDKFVAERIKVVNTPTVGEYTVVTQDRRIRRKSTIRLEESRTYGQTRISQILIELRRNNNLNIREP